MKGLFLFIFMYSSALIFCQNYWGNLYPSVYYNEELCFLAEEIEENYLLFCSKGLSLFNIDKYGNFLAGSYYFSSANDTSFTAYDGIKTSKGTYIIVGDYYDGTYPKSTDSFFSAEIGLDGKIYWNIITKGQFEFPFFFDVVETPDGGYLALGEVKSTEDGTWDIAICKLNSAGGIMWLKIYRGPEGDFPKAIMKNKNDNYIVLADIVSYPERDILIFEIDPSGNVIWAKVYGDNESIIYPNAIEEINNGYIIQYNAYFNTNYDSGFFMIDNSGNLIWNKKIKGYFLTLMKKDEDVNFLIGGSRMNSSGWSCKGHNLTVAKLDENFNLIWAYRYGHYTGFPIRSFRMSDGYLITGVGCIQNENSAYCDLPLLILKISFDGQLDGYCTNEVNIEFDVDQQLEEKGSISLEIKSANFSSDRIRRIEEEEYSYFSIINICSHPFYYGGVLEGAIYLK